jgi:cytochrome b561
VECLKMLRDSIKGYGLVAIFFHWVTGSLVLALFFLGVYMMTLGLHSPYLIKAPQLHISLGIAVTILMSARFLWRLSSQSPKSLASPRTFGYFAEKFIKGLLYFIVFVVLGTGYIVSTSDGQTISCFGLFEVPSLRQYTAVGINRAANIHKYVAWAIVATVALHALAALGHHFIKRDRTLVRMLKPSAK